MAEAAFTIEEFPAGDGYRWRYRRYRATAPKAEVVFLHGIQSHGGWYEYSCTRLAEAGYNVSFLDRRGSGLNDAARGDTPSFRRLLDDLSEFLVILPSLSPRTSGSPKPRVFLAAISWGGKLAVALERRHPGLVDGLMLLSPGFFPKVRTTLGQRLKIFFARLFRARKLFPIPLNDPELFTSNPRWIQFLRDDSLSLHQASARFLVESVRLDRFLRFCPKYVHAPVLLLLAELDRIIHNGKTRAFVDQFAAKEKLMIEYPGAHHTLEFEENPETWIKDMVGWLDQHTLGNEPVRT